MLVLLREHGAKKVVVGESTSHLNHWKVLRQAGVFDVTSKLNVPIIVFDEDGWENVTVGGRYLKRVKLARALRQVDRIVYLCCPKTHHAPNFTGSLKLAMGFVNNWQRTLWPLRHLREKIADLNLVLKHDVILADMRQTFISGGPATGELPKPGLSFKALQRMGAGVGEDRCLSILARWLSA